MQDTWRDRLLLRWIVFNVIGVMCLGYAWYAGLAPKFLLGDTSGVSFAICAVALWSILAGGLRVIETSRDMNSSDRLQKASSSYELKSEIRRSAFRIGIQVCEYLGVVGTVYGLVQAIASHDAASIRAGVAIALYPTLIATVAVIWLFINQSMLQTGLVKLESKLKKSLE